MRSALTSLVVAGLSLSTAYAQYEDLVDFPDAPTADFPDAPDPGAAASKPAANAPPAAPQAKASDAGEEEEGPPPDAAPRTPGVVGSTPGHFEPTEKVRADFDVSFPVDI